MSCSNKDKKLQDYADAQKKVRVPSPQPISSTVDLLSSLEVLPFSTTNDGSLEPDVEELLLDGYVDQLHSSDGFQSFHHLKYVTTNAKQLSQWFQLAMGFQEVAYKGLETGSNIISSHVIKNGGVVIELVSILQPTSKNPTGFPIDKEKYNPNDQDKLLVVNNAMLDMFDEVIKSVWEENLVVDENTSSELLKTVHESSKFGFLKQDLQRILKDLNMLSTFTVQDLMDSIAISNYLTYHGEGVLDVALSVTCLDKVFQKAVHAGALIIKKPCSIHDVHGVVKTATLGIPDTEMRHTLIEVIDYNGPFLPGYQKSSHTIATASDPIKLELIDHCVENYTWNQMDKQAKLYASMFGFHKFWSVDDTIINTGNSSLNSTVMSSSNGRIKIPINEPSAGDFKGQIEEFYDFNGGPGIQHIALRTHDIIATVKAMKRNGVKFNNLTPAYYQNLVKRLNQDDIVLEEIFDELRDLDILIDHDVTTRNPKTKKCHYLLQIFTNSMTDRPTLFFEIIQRHHHNGFGKGTFKGLYESIELEQIKRGTFVRRGP